MALPSRAGTRIREIRLALGMRQADLAQRVGISASYLNLIEHNRRRIAGGVLIRLAGELGVDPVQLSDGTQARTLARLRAVCDRVPNTGADFDRADELASRFPGWVDLILRQDDRIENLENSVAGLSDRLAHDPFLSESVHEILSAVTAIRSAASILAEPGGMDANWQRRFQGNIRTDSERLSEASQALAQYLDTDDAEMTEAFAPHDELSQRLAQIGYAHGSLETGAVGPDDFAQTHFRGLSGAARALGRAYVRRYLADCADLPSQALVDVLGHTGLNPAEVAAKTGVGLDVVLRRLASLPPRAGWPDMGLMVADAAGQLTFVKPLPGFSAPRVGAACALWPLFAAFTQPMTPFYRCLAQSGRAGRDMGSGLFDAYAIATRVGPMSFTGPTIFEATMLLVPRDDSDPNMGPTYGRGDGVMIVGPSCRICPVKDCIARREPSVLAEAFDS